MYHPYPPWWFIAIELPVNLEAAIVELSRRSTGRTDGPLKLHGRKGSRETAKGGEVESRVEDIDEIADTLQPIATASLSSVVRLGTFSPRSVSLIYVPISPKATASAACSAK